MKSQLEYRKNYCKNENETAQRIYLRAFKTKSKVAKIKAKCLDCCAFQATEAANCNVLSCPLYDENPYRKARAKQAVLAARTPKNDVL